MLSPLIHQQSMMYGGYQGYGSGPAMSMTRSQSHVVNLLSEEFIAGYMEQGLMSVARRFFCLFVTFDVIFIWLLWTIGVVTTGDDPIRAMQAQILHYTVFTSLFDVVIAALVRFILLILFYGWLGMNHRLVIALSTTSSCAFLISKVFLYDWTASPHLVFEVLLIVVSFVLAWGETWFLDCRVIPLELYARHNFVGVTSPEDAHSFRTRFAGLTESVGNFYSPIDSIHNSDDDDEEEQQDEDFKRMGTECVRRAYTVLESGSWKIEKVTSKGDTIQSCQVEELGKVYKLTAKVHYPARKLLEMLYYKIEDVPKWNPTIVQSRIIRKIDSHTDITYQATMGGGGGVIKCRDFVNLRCWHLCRDGRVIEGVLPNPLINLSPVTEESEGHDGSVVEEEEDGDSDGSMGKGDVSGRIPASTSVIKKSNATGAGSGELAVKGGNVFVSAAISIEYPNAPKDTIFIRGENKLSCWAMRELENQKDQCIFEWLLCLDLKGYIPRYVLDTAYTTLMQDYMNYLRKYVAEVRKEEQVPGDIESTD